MTHFGLLLLGFLACPLADQAATEAPVAVVTSIQGGVGIQREGQDRFTSTMDTTLLYAGDRLRVGEQGRAVVLHADGRMTPLGARTRLRMDAAGGKSPRWFSLLHQQVRGVLNRDGAPLGLRGYLLRGYLLRGPDANARLVARAPRWCTVLDGRPVFQWEARDPAIDLRLMVEDSQENEVWTVPPDPGATTQDYPAELPPLPPGEYEWEITGRLGGKAELDVAPFLVPGPEEIQRAQSDIETAQRLETEKQVDLPLIVAYLEHRLYPAAETALLASRRRAPQDRTLALLLARVYSEIKRSVPASLQRVIDDKERSCPYPGEHPSG